MSRKELILIYKRVKTNAKHNIQDYLHSPFLLAKKKSFYKWTKPGKMLLLWCGISSFSIRKI